MGQLIGDRRHEQRRAWLFDTQQLRERVQRLTGFERASATPGESRAAEIIAGELRSTGARVNIESERVHGTYWWPLGIATGCAAVAGIAGGWSAAVAGALGATLTADEITAGRRPLRRLLKRQRATNVAAEFGNTSAEHTVLMVAHHDAARSGLVFHPEPPRWLFRRFPALHRMINTTPPTMWSAVAGPALVGLGALSGRRGLRLFGTLVSAGFTAAMIDIASRQVVPGANDNATGVSVLLSLARWLSNDPPEAVRVILLSTGAEEALMEGMQAYARRHFGALPRDRTTVICVDTVGSPHLLLLEGEGMLGVREFPKDFLSLIRRCADEEGIYLWPDLRFRNATDAFVALKAGYECAMIGSVDEFKIPTHYHWPTDVAANVNYDTVADAARLCQRVIADLDQRAGAG